MPAQAQTGAAPNPSSPGESDANGRSVTTDPNTNDTETTDTDTAGTHETGTGLENGEETEEGAQLRAPSMEELWIDSNLGEQGSADQDLAASIALEPMEEIEPIEPGGADAALDAMTAGEAPQGWVEPRAVVDLDGYFRVRGELWDRFWLGREPVPPATTDAPFDRFRPLARGTTPQGGCGEDGDVNSTNACGGNTQRFANMRLRLAPTLTVSDDVRVHMMVDVFDNMVLGSTPDGLAYGFGSDGIEQVTGTGRSPIDSLSFSQAPAGAYRNSLQDSVRVRRAWAEVTNRGLGQLQFGRMGFHWGLGMFANGGEGLDADYQTDVDRILGVTKLANLYWFAAYDFASEGFIQQNLNDPQAFPVDAGQRDDVNQFTLAVAKQTDPETEEATLEDGGWVLDGGLLLLLRNQLLTAQGVTDPTGSNADAAAELIRRDAKLYVPDLWFRALHGNLRIEFEAALLMGSIENTSNDAFAEDEWTVRQFGAALETEYRLADNKLSLGFHTGYATGDPDVEGLVNPSGLASQVDDTRLSTFRFHPNYRIDLILWRNIMQQISGAYYFKPSISYDFLKSDFGQLFGVRTDIIYSRASSPVQTWGNDPNLGLELNATLYYRSEDGPELEDGFHAMLQYGVLFPMKGLGYLEDDNGVGEFPDGNNPDLSNAQILRLVMGVQF